jgi:Tfp pilus assembly protein PilF
MMELLSRSAAFVIGVSLVLLFLQSALRVSVVNRQKGDRLAHIVGHVAHTTVAHVASRRRTYDRIQDALAWVLYKNGQFSEAGRSMEKALSLHTNDPQLLFHAGMISHSLAKDAEAEDFLSRALKTNPHFHVLDAEVAAHTLADINRSQSADSRSSNAQR